MFLLYHLVRNSQEKNTSNKAENLQVRKGQKTIPFPLSLGIYQAFSKTKKREGDRNRSFVRIRFRRPISAQLQQSERLLKVADKGNIVSVNIGHL